MFGNSLPKVFSFLKLIHRILHCISRSSAEFGLLASAYTTAIAAEIDGEFLWVWIGTHGEYDKLRI